MTCHHRIEQSHVGAKGELDKIAGVMPQRMPAGSITISRAPGLGGLLEIGRGDGVVFRQDWRRSTMINSA